MIVKMTVKESPGKAILTQWSAQEQMVSRSIEDPVRKTGLLARHYVTIASFTHHGGSGRFFHENAINHILRTKTAQPKVLAAIGTLCRFADKHMRERFPKALAWMMFALLGVILTQAGHGRIPVARDPVG
jgi:hypothetical protein